MGKTIKDQSTNTLIYAQQMIDLASREMRDFFGQVDKDFKEKKVSQSYHEKLEKNLYTRVQKNNDVTDEIEKELHKRVERDFPGITTSRLITVFVENWKKEMADYKKLNEKAPKEEKPVVTLKKSKEKKV